MCSLDPVVCPLGNPPIVWAKSVWRHIEHITSRTLVKYTSSPLKDLQNTDFYYIRDMILECTGYCSR